MFRIGICDDESRQRENIRELCERYFTEIGQKFECVCFSNGEEVLKYKGERFLLFFLDIELGSMNGIEVMKRIEETALTWRIVFISSHTEAVFQTFGLRTLDFGQKPITYQKVRRWIAVAIRENKKNILIKFQTVSGILEMSLEDIEYIEGAANYSLLYKGGESHFINGNLKTMEQKLADTSMIRIHKSYLVNMDKIKEIKNGSVYLSDCICIPIGRQYKSMLTDIYREYIRDKVYGRLL